MNRFIYFCLLFTLSWLSEVLCNNNNNYPIILIHGFGGWGRNELLGFKYWGGLYGDLESKLNANGFQVYTVSMGPVSSNWDRVCEAWSQIVGGTVDYGASHSAQYQHARFGRTYNQALYPQWGQINPKTGGINKVHIIAHSMGGQDARLLSHLLMHGSDAEVAVNAFNTSSLFTGKNRDWIASITTVSSPHDGTTLAAAVNQFVPFVVGLVGAVGALAGVSGSEVAKVYDLKLDQFGLVQNPGESLNSYLNRVLSSAVFNGNFQDVSLYDLSPIGAQLHNAIWTCNPNIYYTSYSTQAVYQLPIIGSWLPEAWMFALFWPFATLMGSSSTFSGVYDSSWLQSDGVVNLRSMAGPMLQVNPSSSCPVVTNNNPVAGGASGGLLNPSTLKKGVWNHQGIQSGWDHATIIGVGLHDVTTFYNNIATTASSFPILDLGLYTTPQPTSTLSTSTSPTTTIIPSTTVIPSTIALQPTTSSPVNISNVPTAFACSQAKSAYATMCNSQTGANGAFTASTCAAIEANVIFECSLNTTTGSDTKVSTNNNNNNHVGGPVDNPAPYTGVNVFGVDSLFSVILPLILLFLLFIIILALVIYKNKKSAKELNESNKRMSSVPLNNWHGPSSGSISIPPSPLTPTTPNSQSGSFHSFRSPKGGGSNRLNPPPIAEEPFMESPLHKSRSLEGQGPESNDFNLV